MDTFGASMNSKSTVDEMVQMFEALLELPLKTADDGSFTLSRIPAEKRIAEFEFMFKLAGGFTGEDIKNTVRDYCSQKFNVDLQQLGAWKFRASGGYMTGFIDLFFEHDGKYYVIDWKSNRLDGTAESFVPDRINREILKNFFIGEI